MTFNQLKEEVCAYGFESDTEGDANLLAVANRALKSIFSLFCHTGQLRFPVSEIRTLETIPLIKHGKGESISIPLRGDALSFLPYGIGNYKITDSFGERRGEFNSFGKWVKAYVYGEGVIEFFGDYTYSVSNLTFFEGIFTLNEDDVPIYNQSREIEIRKLAPDYISPLGLPLTRNGKAIPGSAVKDGRIILPEGYSGEVVLEYKRMPKPIDGDFPDNEIDVLPKYEHLLPLLTAAYVWLGGEEELATYYMSIYREEAARLKREGNGNIDTRFEDLLGWA